MNIADLKRTKMPEAWFTYDTKSGSRIKLLYLSLSDYRKRIENCTELVDGKEKLNDDKLLKETASLLLDWDFTVSKIADLLPITVPEGQGDVKVPCTEENKLTLLTGAWGFKDYVNAKVTALSDFMATEREAQRKNSASSPTGSSAADLTAPTAVRSSAS